MMVWVKRILGWVGIVAVLAGGWWWLQAAGAKHEKAHEEKPIEAVAVTVYPVVQQAVERYASVVGTLEGIEEVLLTPKVEGRVKTILHDVNASLAPDSPILILDDVDHKLAEAEAQRTLELELAKVGLRADRLPSQGKEEDAVITSLPLVIRARNLEENASRRMQRFLKLGNVASAEDVDQSRTDLRVAQANYLQQQIESRAILAGAREKLAKLQSAQQRLRDTTLRVPTPSPERLAEIARARGLPAITAAEIRYVVAERKVSEGELVRANSTGAFRLVLDRPLKLVAMVPERYLGEVRIGQPVRLGVEAYPSEQFAGKVVRLNPTVDRVNRTFQVEVTIPNDDRQLRAGMFVRASIQTRREDQALVVPEEALVSFAGVNKVFVVRGESVQSVPVRLGERLETSENGRRLGWLEVHGDLKAGERVVTSGQTKLADGTPIRIRGTDRTE